VWHQIERLEIKLHAQWAQAGSTNKVSSIHPDQWLVTPPPSPYAQATQLQNQQSQQLERQAQELREQVMNLTRSSQLLKTTNGRLEAECANLTNRNQRLTMALSSDTFMGGHTASAANTCAKSNEHDDSPDGATGSTMDMDVMNTSHTSQGVLELDQLQTAGRQSEYKPKSQGERSAHSHLQSQTKSQLQFGRSQLPPVPPFSPPVRTICVRG
jgi:hypothetical protein